MKRIFPISFKKIAPLLLGILFTTLTTFGQTETFPSGSFIINMGSATPTVNNTLRPYGLMWDLIRNNKAIVKWIINPTKGKDGIDFTYNSIDYKGGTFIIPARFITPAVQAKINALYPSIISGAYTTTSLTLTVSYTIKYNPRWTFDFQNGSIAQSYLTAANIPISGYPMKYPSQLNDCDDLFAMPHADPVWSTHNNLLTWNQNSKGWIWAACHAVSAMENIYNPANPAQQMNFLSDRFADFGPGRDITNGWAANSLVLWTAHTNPITPFTYAYPNDAEMQFMGLVDGGIGANGSERGYMPYNATTGGGNTTNWRATTKIGVYDGSPAATNPNVPEFSNGLVGEVIYGRAFGNVNYGKVLYEAGHTHVGTTVPFVNAQKIFFNFSYLSTYDKDPLPVPNGPTNIMSGSGGTYSVSLLKAGFNIDDYTISWSATCSGTFSNQVGQTTTFIPSAVGSCGPCTITATVTDVCGRSFYEFVDINVCPAVPIALDRTTPVLNNPPSTGPIDIAATTPLVGTDPDGTIVSYTITSLPIVSQGVLYYDNDGNGGTPDVVVPANVALSTTQMLSIKFDPADGFAGNAIFNYTVTDNAGFIDATPATYTIPVNPPPVAQDILAVPRPSTAGPTLITPALNATDNGTIVNYTISTLPLLAHGILYLNGVPVTAGQVITPAQASQLYFDPSGTYVGYATFTYTATDNNGSTDPTPATVNIQIVNQPPVAQDISSPAIANPNGTSQTAIPALQATDPDGSIASYTISTLPPASQGVLYYFNGSSYVVLTAGLVLSPAQSTSLRFDPTDGFSGNAIFTYTATDNNALLDNTPATYIIPVGIVPPIATPITNAAIYSGAGQTAISALAATDPDATNVIVSYTISTLPSALLGILYYNNGTSYVPATAGLVITPAQSSTLKFDPVDGASGNVVFTFTATDDEGLIDLSPATFTIPLTNNPPVATNITNPSLTSADGTTTISALNASDADGVVVNYTIISLPLASQGVLFLSGVPLTTGQIITPAQAALLQFDPAPGSTGSATFLYTATDDQGASDITPATFTIPITFVNQPPVANNVTNATIRIDANATSISPLTGTDPDGTVVTYTITSLPTVAQGVLYLYGVPVTVGQVISAAQAGNLTFDPSGTFVGNAVFNYTATDNYGLTDATPAVYTLPIVNLPPVASDITSPQIKTSNTRVLPPLYATDSDGSIANYTVNSLPGLGTLQVDLTGSGTFTNVTVGQVLTPLQAARLRFVAGATVGTATFFYTATDNNGSADATPATYTIPVGAANGNLPPNADDKINTSLSANAGITSILSLSATDPDGTIASYTVTNPPPDYMGTLYYFNGTTNVVIVPGTVLTPTQAANMRFDPSGTFLGNVTFNYTATDNLGLIDDTEALFTIPLTNNPPIAVNVTNTAIPSSAGSTLISSLSATDSDGTIYSYTITSLPSANQGVLYLDGVALIEGSILTPAQAIRLQFDPNPTFSGNVVFGYTARDNLGYSDQTPATFTIPVTNQPPVADNKISPIIINNIGTPAQSIPSLSAVDSDGTIATFTILTLPTGGILYLNAVAVTANQVIVFAQAGNLSFDPNDGFSGSTSFTYTATDNSGLIDATPATFQIAVNTPPTTTNITTSSMFPGGANTGIPVLVGADDGSIQFYTITTLPTVDQGILYLNSVAVTYLSQVDSLTTVQAGQLSFTPAATFTGTTYTYTATDNLGVIDVTPALYTIPLKVYISGNVFNDLNGNLSLDGFETAINGTNVGGGITTGAVLYANLVNELGNVIAVSPVLANGSYTFLTVPSFSTLTIQLTTNQGTVGNPKPTTVISSGWVITGENKNGLGGDPDTNPNSEIIIFIGSANATTQNFGIEQPPTAGALSAASQVNPGGTTSASVAAATFSGTDASSGTISSLLISAFPSNATSITINGTTYTSGTFPGGGVSVPTNTSGQPTQAISVDPINGAVTVVIPYFVTDNAGQLSSITGSASVPFTTVTVSGTVYNDVNGMTNSLVDGAAGTNGGGVNAYLVDGSGNIASSVAVAANGTYTLPNVNGGTYSVLLSTSVVAIGSPAPTASLLSGWVNTGEGTTAAGDGTVNGQTNTFAITTTDISNVNFGIEQPPTAGALSAASQVNPGGTTSASVAASTFSGTDASSGTISSLLISAFPSNATSITINGTNYTSGTFPGVGVSVPTNTTGQPTQTISVDPINGAVTIVIPYFVTDNAGKQSATAGSASVPFTTVTVSGTVFNDVNGMTNSLVDGAAGTNGGGVNAYLVDGSGNIASSVAVAANGTYTLPNVNGGTYSVLLSTSVVAIGSPAPTASLLSGWVNTGEGTTAAGDGTVNGQTNTFAITTTNISNVNFGIEQRPTSGNGSNTNLNPGGTIQVGVPASSFTNLLVSSDLSSGIITAVRISSFPGGVASMVINGVSYTSGTFPGGGLAIPTNAVGNPTLSISVDPIAGGLTTITIPFYAKDNAGYESLLAGSAVLILNEDIDRDDDGITNINENSGYDPYGDCDSDGIQNYADNTPGCSTPIGNDPWGIAFKVLVWSDLNNDGINDFFDRDRDGVMNELDLDSDNDGIADVVEAGGVDANGDGRIDNYADADGDGLSNNADNNNVNPANNGVGLGYADFDGDGIPNFLDLDSDNDGIPDVVEANGTDANNDGLTDGFTDSDGDGFSNNVDGDVGNDGTAENTANVLIITGADTNNDGRPESYSRANQDGRGWPNPYDLDADGDGILDVREAGLTDSNNDGIADGVLGADGWSDTVDALAALNLTNTDATGRPNYLDIDADDDGIVDNIEAQATVGYMLPSGNDADGDGIDDAYDNNDAGFAGLPNNGIVPVNTDNTDNPDYTDLDSDNDRKSDRLEGWDVNGNGRINGVERNFTGIIDTDDDGLLDQYDNVSNVNLSTNVTNNTNAYYHPDINNPGGNLDWRENQDADRDGLGDVNDIDDDNDGIPDLIENGGYDVLGDADGDGIANYIDPTPGAGMPAFVDTNADGINDYYDSDKDGIINNLDRDSDNDGIADVVEAGGADADGDGIIDNYTDTDSDGFSQNVDANNSGESSSGSGLGLPDFDNDGVPNIFDLDSDNDGIPDVVEAYGTDANNDGLLDGLVDADNDGWADPVDGDADGDNTVENLAAVLIITGTDSNNDGRPEKYTTRGNLDNHGLPNFIDLDSDNDGITDAVESGITTASYFRGMVSGCALVNGWCSLIDALPTLNLINTDGIGKADVYDIDADNDGITDNIEGLSTGSYTLPTNTDTDGDGLIDAYDFFNGIGGNGITPFDFDFDGVPDYRDLDTDNDGSPDRNESDKRNLYLLQATINSSGDADGDGLMDQFDIYDIGSQPLETAYKNVSASTFGPSGNYGGPVPGGTNVSVVKSIATAPDRDWRNVSLLALQITGLTGKLQNNIAQLTWQAPNETEVEKYEVERSTDGIHFTTVAIVNALNKDKATYTIENNVAGLDYKTVYFRIRQVNKNGQIYHTNVVSFDNIEGNQLSVKIYPNPVQSNLNMMLKANASGTAQVVITDVSGKRIFSKKYVVQKGMNTIAIDEAANWRQGNYLIQIILPEGKLLEKILKQ